METPADLSLQDLIQIRALLLQVNVPGAAAAEFVALLQRLETTVQKLHTQSVINAIPKSAAPQPPAPAGGDVPPGVAAGMLND